MVGVESNRGIVYLVGAGPGDPGLLTMRGAQCLARADVVVYDRLANPCLLAYAQHAELIDVGKEPDHHRVNQNQIDALLVEKARAGKVVVRLKGGDPFVFGRGGEEAAALAQAGLPFEIVPGITSAIAAPAFAGIPVTHRGVACSVAFATGHRAAQVEDPACDWRKLAQGPDTLVFLMGIHNLALIAGELIANGRDPATPVAVIAQATGPDQRTVTGTLADITRRAADICPPAVIIVGEVVRLRDTLRWFDSPDGTVPSSRNDECIGELLQEVIGGRDLAESLVRRNQQLAMLNALAMKINQSLALEDILRQALDALVQLTGVDAGAIFLRQDTLGKLELVAYRGLSEEAAWLAAELGMLDGSCGGVMDHHQVTIIPDITRYRGKRAESLRREHLATLVHVPLMARGEALGSMCVGTRCQRLFDPEEQALMTALGNQIAVAVENARLYAELANKERLRGELFKKSITAQEEERKRIARELHDDTSQALAALLFAAEEAMEVGSPDEIQAMLKRMHDLAQNTLDGVHKMIFDLRPTILDHLGLVPALRWLAQSRLEPSHVRVTISEAETMRRLPPEAETALFRTVQEAISNIARHALARNVHITFESSASAVCVTVEDDGIGFDPVELTLSPGSGRGLGLAGMYERINLLGGQVQIDTAPGFGTRIHISMPVEEGDRGA